MDSVFSSAVISLAWQHCYERESIGSEIQPMRHLPLVQAISHGFPATTALLKGAIRDRVFPGCVFAVLAGRDTTTTADVQAVGRFTYEPESLPVEPGTIFDLASLTKVLATTAAVMWLLDR